MKQIMTISFILLALSFKAKAAVEGFEKGADQLHEIAKCQLLDSNPEMDLDITISTGGIAGVTQIRVERHFEGDALVNTFVVKQDVGTSSFTGNGIRLTADFTRLMSNGGYYATLQLNLFDTVTFEKLSCFAVHQNPQVNYAY